MASAFAVLMMMTSSNGVDCTTCGAAAPGNRQAVTPQTIVPGNKFAGRRSAGS
jgi:hypothetical protein